MRDFVLRKQDAIRYQVVKVAAIHNAAFLGCSGFIGCIHLYTYLKYVYIYIYGFLLWLNIGMFLIPSLAALILRSTTRLFEISTEKQTIWREYIYTYIYILHITYYIYRYIYIYIYVVYSDHLIFPGIVQLSFHEFPYAIKFTATDLAWKPG